MCENEGAVGREVVYETVVERGGSITFNIKS